MKESMREVGKRFSSHRMLLEYAQSFYIPALANARSFSQKGFALSREVAAYLDRIRKAWGALRIESLTSSSHSILTIGEKISVDARIFLAGLSPEELGVELYYGALSSQGEIEEPRRLEMRPCGSEGDSAKYCAEVICDRTGRQGFTLRILPKQRALVHPFLPGLVKWA
jgi:starch phosphorylase